MHLGSAGFRRQSTLASPVLVEVATADVVVVVVVVDVEVDRNLSRCVTDGFLVKKNGIFRVTGAEVCCSLAVVGVGVIGVIGVIVVEVPVDIGARDPGAGRQPWPSDPSTQPGV